MELVTRPWITFAAVLIGAATIFAGSAVGPLPIRPEFQEMKVRLATESSTSWQDVLQTADASAEDISNHFSYAFFPALQQEAVNRVDLIEELIKDPSQYETIANHFVSLVGSATAAHFSPFIPPADAADHLYTSLNGDHQDYFQTLLQSTDGSDQSLVEFLVSPISGVLWGNVDTVLSPIVQLGDDLSGIAGALGDGDFTTASQELSDMPVNVVNAFLNGYGPVDVTLPLSSLVPGSDTTITSVYLGGFFSTGGSVFDALGLSDAGITSPATGEAVGTLGSLVAMQEAIAVAIGWDGIGNPIEALFDGGV